MKRVLLVDGNSLLFRAYYATKFTQPMRTSSGVATNAVYGFINMFTKAQDIIKPDLTVVCFDAGKKTFRTEMFSDYKGTRKEVDADLVVQFPIVREYLDALGVLRLERAGFEADDLIGSLAQNKELSFEILTSDRDLLQLIDDNVEVLLMKKGISELDRMDRMALELKYDLVPKQIIDLKALMGDTADNIPGISGIGEKTALKLLGDYQNIDGIYANVDKLKGKLKERIENNKEIAYLSYELATIKTDLDFDFDLVDFNDNFKLDNLRAFYANYEMNSFLKRLDAERVDEVEAVQEVNVAIVNKLDTNLFAKRHGLQFIFNPLDKCEGLLVLSDNHYYISLNDLLNDEASLAHLVTLNNAYTYDAKKQYRLLAEVLELGEFKDDVMVANFIIDSNHNTLEKALAYYEIDYTDLFEYTFGKPKKLKEYSESELVSYLSMEAKAYSGLANKVLRLIKAEHYKFLYEQVEMPLVKVLTEMELTGIGVDEHTLTIYANNIAEKLGILESEIYQLAGHEFNISSPKQLGIVLFDELELKDRKKRSTAAEVLEKLALEHPIVPLILEYRRYSKIYSTYAVGLQKHIAIDQRIHTKYNQCLTQTGRLSSTEPNLQNISVRDEEGKEVRKAFVAKEGCILVAADYSQIELRILAQLANEENLLLAFKEKQDIHTQTAMKIYHKSASEVSENERRNAKAVNFGIIYGMSDFGLSENLGISFGEARDIIKKYFEMYPQIKVYMDAQVKQCTLYGYVETLWKRRRYIHDISSSNRIAKDGAARAAMNSPIQGSAADLIKIAMVKVAQAFKEHNFKSKMLLQVHDELIFEVEEAELAAVKTVINEVMTNIDQVSVELEVNIAEGKTWFEAK